MYTDKRSRIANTILKEKEKKKIRGLTQPELKTYYKLQ